MGESARMWGSIAMTHRKIHINDRADRGMTINYQLSLRGGSHTEVLFMT